VSELTFWSAARDIVAECHAILKPGGVAVFVTKDFVRDKKRVPFSADWVRLCESCGFRLVKWARASLVSETRHGDLFCGETVKRTERKSFFRRLAEKKGSPRIDHEDVLFLMKDGGDGWVDGVDGSPPFQSSLSDAPSKNIVSSGLRMGQSSMGDGYGAAPGQLGALPPGNVDAVVCSPPFATGDSASAESIARRTDKSAGWIKANCGSEGYGSSLGQLAVMPTGTVDAVVSSPPYAEIAAGAGGLNTKPAKEGQQGGRAASSASQDTDRRYGECAGQLSRMEGGTVDAVVGSPPYAGCEQCRDGEFEMRSTDANPTARRLDTRSYFPAPMESEGQLGALPEGGVDAVVSSPPFQGSHQGTDAEFLDHVERTKAGGAPLSGRKTPPQDYGNSSEQLGARPAGRPGCERERQPYAEVVWHRCYDETWKGLIVDGAFAHPAKMARGLVHRIFDELFVTGVIRKGSQVVDPFGGIGTTALEGASRGVNVTVCELEPKFVALSNDNVELHRRGWQLTGLPIPRIVLGDSRKLRDHIRRGAA
jgi:hypothetical protein